MSNAHRAKITRVDCAHDFFHGEYTPQQALSEHSKGLFDRANRRPKLEMRGTDWHSEDGTGRTLYLGRRGSSKLVRIYEKGKQLKDPTSQWVRFEIEFRNRDCVIPLDILKAPGEFLTGAYPVGEVLFTSKACRIDAKVEKVNLTFDSKLVYAKNQVGRMIRFLSDLGWSNEQIVKALIGDEGKYPKGLQPSEYDCKEVGDYIYITLKDVELSQTAGDGINEPDKLDEIIEITHEIDGFRQSDEPKTELQQQLLNEFPQELQEWLGKFIQSRKSREYWSMSEQNLNDFIAERERIEREFDEVIGYFYLKYGTLFYKRNRR